MAFENTVSVNSHSVAPPDLPRYRFGNFELHVRSGELSKNGAKLRLQDQPFLVLRKLLESAGTVVAREDLHAALWPADTFVDFDTSLNTAIKRLREVLGDSADNPVFIETVPRRGYRFLAPVQVIQDGGVSPVRGALTLLRLPLHACDSDSLLLGYLSRSLSPACWLWFVRL